MKNKIMTFMLAGTMLSSGIAAEPNRGDQGESTNANPIQPLMDNFAQQLKLGLTAVQQAAVDFQKSAEKFGPALAAADVPGYGQVIGQQLVDSFNISPGGGIQRIRTAGAGTGEDRPLIVGYSTPPEGTLAEMNEDLNVMAKLIEDALRPQPGEQTARVAMGITIGSDGKSVRSMYIGGYGALFTTTVRFPLTGPEERPVAATANPGSNTAWETARQELYGQGNQATITGTSSNAKLPEFDAAKVEELKATVIKLLANANNLRQVQSSESVTMVLRESGIARSPGADVFTTRVVIGGTGAKVRTANGKTMTVRVKKKDAEDRAAGKITEEEFRKRATIAVY